MQYKQKGAHIIEVQLDEFSHTEHICVTRCWSTAPQMLGIERCYN